MIYVDELVTRRQYPKARTKRCRMGASSVSELHEFAGKMGIPRSAFLYPPEHQFHYYDIGVSQRDFAIANGAITVSSESFDEFAAKCKRK